MDVKVTFLGQAIPGQTVTVDYGDQSFTVRNPAETPLPAPLLAPPATPPALVVNDLELAKMLVGAAINEPEVKVTIYNAAGEPIKPAAIPEKPKTAKERLAAVREAIETRHEEPAELVAAVEAVEAEEAEEEPAPEKEPAEEVQADQPAAEAEAQPAIVPAARPERKPRASRRKTTPATSTSGAPADDKDLPVV